MALKKDIDSLLLMLLSRFFPVLRGLINESLFAPVGAYARKVKIIVSASLIRMKTTIASDVKIKINFPRHIFMHHNTAMEVSSL